MFAEGLEATLALWSTPALVGVGLLAYIAERGKAGREREAARDQQTKMHAENAQKLNALMEAREDQQLLNRTRDKQVSALERLADTTAKSLENITKGLDHRVEMIENELRDTRRHIRHA